MILRSPHRYTFPMQPVSQPVSIVVTVLNEAGDIGRVVHSLLAQTPVAAEVIVVDGGSSDGTWEWLAETQTKDPRLVAIRDETCSLKYSAGPVSRGRNVAIAAAASGIIATADAGCTYAPDWVANLTAPLRYAVSDGQARVRMPRLFRNAARCVLELLALASLWWSVVPLLVVLVLESWFAFHKDWRFLRPFGMKAVLARFVFSVAVPWVVAANHLYGLFSTKPQTNRQNVAT